MKKLIFGFAALWLFVLFSAAEVAYAQPAVKSVAPSATFQKVWIDYDVTEEGRRGMRIHAAFKAHAMKDVPAYLQIRFQDSAGAWLKDKNGSFDDVEGSVAAFRSLKPGFDPAVYEDLSVFMPYDELDLQPGTYLLKMDVDLIYEAGGIIQHLTLHPIEYTKPSVAPVVKTTSTPSATFERIWVDYDVTEGGKYGMRIHAKFTVYNMKKLPSYLAIYFSKADGTRLLTNNREYRSKDGQVALYKLLDITYDPGVYSDLKLFLPYSELSLSPGKYDLKMSVDLIYKEGGLIQHLTDYEFEYTKP